MLKIFREEVYPCFMEKKYVNDHLPQFEVDNKKYFGFIERAANLVGVFVFYMLVFSAISVISGGLKF